MGDPSPVGWLSDAQYWKGGDRPLTPVWDGLGEQFESGGKGEAQVGKAEAFEREFFLKF